ncbi:MAG: hypothetical protein QGG74_02420 [Phycisphaerales bacterium]|nr:hypothetical protein [Phycisphaerales bacterium]
MSGPHWQKGRIRQLNRLLWASLLFCLIGCTNPDLPTTEAGVKKWSKACADRLIVEARNWYEGTQPNISDEQFAFDVQAFLATAGSQKTYRLVMDRHGIPIDVTWDNDFWDAAASFMSAEEMKNWKVYSVRVLDAVCVATGVRPPHSWSDPAAMPVLSTVAAISGMPPEAAMASLDRLIPLPERRPVTLKLRTLMPQFPDAAVFPQSP